MADDPYYYPDGKAFGLRTETRPEYDFSDSRNGPRPGLTIRAGDRKIKLLKAKEKMDWDPEIPVKDKISHLCARFPHIPYDIIHVIAGDTPEWSVDQLAEVLQNLDEEDVAFNCGKAEPGPPCPPPPLPGAARASSSVPSARKSRVKGAWSTGPPPPRPKEGASSSSVVYTQVGPAPPRCTVSQPGLVHICGLLDSATQQWLADEMLRLGQNPEGQSGGLFRVFSDGRVGLNRGHFGNYPLALRDMQDHFGSLVQLAMARASEADASLPPFQPSTCCVKLFSAQSKGLLWHRHGNSCMMLIFVGLSLDFLWKNGNADPDNALPVQSGDIVVFGGASNRILHRPGNIKGGTLPRGLRMRQGVFKLIVY
eukprot:RCo025351